jgi:hypothetical protein
MQHTITYGNLKFKDHPELGMKIGRLGQHFVRREYAEAVKLKS